MFGQSYGGEHNFMDQRQADKVLIIANAHGTGVDSMVNGCRVQADSMAEHYGPKRNMTLFEERVLRCVHHEFHAMTQEEAAVELNVSPATISRTLTELEERAKTCTPIQIMFPILTKLQFEVFTCIVKQGMSAIHTATSLGLTEVVVNKMMTTMRNKGVKIPKRCSMPKSKSYTPSMDKDVKNKF
jgi:transposase